MTGAGCTKRQVLDYIETKKLLILNSYDLEEKENIHEIRWRNTLAFTRKHLEQAGYLVSGIYDDWSVTEDGVNYFIDLASKFRTIPCDAFRRITPLGLSFIFDKINHVFLPSENHADRITEREAMAKVRIGQAIFKKNIMKHRAACEICGLENPRLLIASHIKPWSASNPEERLDEHNGLLLCAQHDALFDKGFISFDEQGRILVSKRLSQNDIQILNITNDASINVSIQKWEYLKWHQRYILK